MSYFNEIYLKRLNKYGKSYKERTQGLREKTFSYYADRSVYKVTFEYNENEEIFFPILVLFDQNDQT